MVPVVRIGDGNWERLKQWAIPLEDSVDDTLGRLLDIAEVHSLCSSHTNLSERKLHPQTVANPSPANVSTNSAAPDIGDNVATSKRLPRGLKVPNEAYEHPILESVYELGGKARMRDVLPLVESKMKHLFSEVDYQITPGGGDYRWRNTAQWARNTLVHRRGLLKQDSGHGMWELTAQGITEVEKSRG